MIRTGPRRNPSSIAAIPRRFNSPTVMVLLMADIHFST
jgi:hypothetical protein